MAADRIAKADVFYNPIRYLPTGWWQYTTGCQLQVITVIVHFKTSVEL